MTTVPEEAVTAAASALRWSGDTLTEMATAALTTALPFLPVQGVKVKALEWGKSSVSEQDKAQTVVGSYFISKHTVDAHNLMFDNDQITALLSVHTSLEAAKAAAQADFEARILSALEPSAARSLALEEGFRKGLEAACEVIDAHSEYDRRMCCDGHECGCYGATVHQSMQHYIRALSSTDHADAGKVEGDGWLPIESAPKDGTVIQVWHQVHKCPISVLWKDDGFPYRGKRLNWYERTYTTAWPEHVFFYWRPLPSAPASEGAE